MTAAVGLLVVVVSLVAGEPILTALAGSDFGAAAGLLTLLLLAASIDLGGASFRPACYVMGKARALLNVQILATVVYLAAFLGLVHLYGLAGIGMASLLTAVVGFAGSGVLVQSGCRARVRSDGGVKLEGSAG